MKKSDSELIVVQGTSFEKSTGTPFKLFDVVHEILEKQRATPMSESEIREQIQSRLKTLIGKRLSEIDFEEGLLPPLRYEVEVSDFDKQGIMNVSVSGFLDTEPKDEDD